MLEAYEQVTAEEESDVESRIVVFRAVGDIKPLLRELVLCGDQGKLDDSEILGKLESIRTLAHEAMVAYAACREGK